MNRRRAVKPPLVSFQRRGSSQEWAGGRLFRGLGRPSGSAVWIILYSVEMRGTHWGEFRLCDSSTRLIMVLAEWSSDVTRCIPVDVAFVSVYIIDALFWVSRFLVGRSVFVFLSHAFQWRWLFSSFADIHWYISWYMSRFNWFLPFVADDIKRLLICVLLFVSRQFLL